MKLHIPVQILLDPVNDAANPADFSVQAALKHTLTKVGIKHAGPQLQGDAVKFINKSPLGKGGFKAVYQSEQALSFGGTESEPVKFYDYVLARVNKPSESLFSEVVRDMVVAGATKRTFYLSFKKQDGAMKVMMYLPRIQGSANESLKGRDGAIAFVHHFKQLKQLHLSGYSHRDVKADNYMFDNSAKKGTLIDFGSLCHPWQYSDTGTPDWHFSPGCFKISNMEDSTTLINTVQQPFRDNSEWKEELKKRRSYPDIKAQLKKNNSKLVDILPMFGVFYDNAGLLKYGIDKCGILDLNEQYKSVIKDKCKTAIKQMFHPSAMVDVVNTVIEAYGLTEKELECIEFHPVTTCSSPEVRFNPKEAQMNEENLAQALEQYISGEEIVVADGYYGGALITNSEALYRYCYIKDYDLKEEDIQEFKQFAYKAIQADPKKYGLTEEDLQEFKQFAYKEDTEEEEYEEEYEEEDFAKKLKRMCADDEWLFDQWYRQKKKLTYSTFTGFRRQFRQLLDSMGFNNRDKLAEDKTPLGKLLSLLGSDLFDCYVEVEEYNRAVNSQVMATLLTRLFLASAINSEGKASVSEPTFITIFETLVLPAPGKEFLQKYWDADISTVGNTKEFFELLQRQVQDHPLYQSLFLSANTDKQKVIDSLTSDINVDSLYAFKGLNLQTRGWDQDSGGVYEASKLLKTGGGHLSNQQMLAAIEEEQRQMHNQNAEMAAAVKHDGMVQGKGFNVDDIKRSINTVFDLLFAEEVVAGIDEYYKDIAKAYAGSLV